MNWLQMLLLLLLLVLLLLLFLLLLLLLLLLAAYQNTGEGGFFRRGEFRGENFAVKKSGEIFPLAKVLQRVTGGYFEFRHAQRCIKQREGTRDVFVCNMQWLCPECIGMPCCPRFGKKGH